MTLAVHGLSGGYGPARILDAVSLTLGPGEVLALLGRNGAGKSTCLKMIAGLLPPSAGRVELAGLVITGWGPARIARAGLAWVPEDRRIFTDLTVGENLRVGQQAPRLGLPVWDMAAIFALFPALAALRGRPAGRMSGGEQQMLAIARALMGNPACLLLDEPAEGLAPVIVDQLIDALCRLQQAGVAILLAEQSLHIAQALATRAAIIETGRIVWTGAMATLSADLALRRRYLAVG